ncbi:M24 family metallopeptidase [Chloroflexota bacterium]
MVEELLTLKERDWRWEKTRKAMKEQGLDCLVIYGSNAAFGTMLNDLRYLAAISDIGYLVFPLEGEPTTFTFEQGLPGAWVKDNRVGHPKYSTLISERLRELHLESARIGVSAISGYLAEWAFPYAALKILEGNFPKASFVDATELMEGVRRVKSDVEVKILELACDAGMKVTQTVLETARAGVKTDEVKLKIMNTSFMAGCEPDFMLFLYANTEGVHAAQGGWSQPPSNQVLKTGEVILMEYDAKYLGYIAQFNQCFAVGEPSKEWKEVYNAAAESFERGVEVLKPGLTIGELDEVFLTSIKNAGYVVLNPAFHCLGIGMEMPMGFYLAQQATYTVPKDFIIEAGMVFEFEPHAVSPDFKRGIHIGVPVLVTDTGCRLLAKNWKPEFPVV